MGAHQAFLNLPDPSAAQQLKDLLDRGQHDLLISALQALKGELQDQLHIALDETYRFIMDSGRRTQEEAARIGKRDVLWKLEQRYPDLYPQVPIGKKSSLREMWKKAGLQDLPQGRGSDIRNL